MQSLSNVDDKNLKNNRVFKELTKKRKYWDKKPVILPENFQESLNNEDLKAKAIVVQKKEETPQEKGDLMKGFEWETKDLDNEKDLDDVYQFLYNNYVEDDDGMFRFDYR